MSGVSPILVSSPVRKGVSDKSGAKKGGAGGKGTWGVPGDEMRFTESTDPNDPLYDPDDQEAFSLDALPPKEIEVPFKDLVDRTISDYLEIGDPKATAKALQTTHSPTYRYYTVVKLIREALPAHTQKAISLLEILFANQFLSQEQLEHGLRQGFSNLKESELDNPGASQAFTQLLDHLEKHDLVTSKFAANQKEFESRFPALKVLLTDALSEFFVNFAIEEFATTLRVMKCAPFHPLAVKYIIRGAIDQPNPQKEASAKLIAHLSASQLSMLECMRGFELLLQETEDILLDNPQAKKPLSEFLARAVVDECVPPSFLGHVFCLREGDVGLEVVQSAGSLLQQPLASKHIHSLWVEQENS